MQLFRQQAMDAQGQRLEGDVIVLPRLSHSLLLVGLLCWISACGLWLSQGNYTRKETIRGWLAPADGMVRIRSDRSGIVKRLLVANGDKVQAGQALLVLNGDHILPSGAHLEELLLTEFEQQRQTLRQQLDRDALELLQRQEQLQLERQATDHALQLADRQLHTLTRRQLLLDDRLHKFRLLNTKGHIASTELDGARLQQLTLESELHALQRERAALVQRQGQLHFRRLMLPQEYANRSDELKLRLSEIARQIAQLHGSRSSVVTASRTGTVHDLRAVVGQQIAPGGALLTILPQDSSLQAELLVPMRAAALLRPGQTIYLRYDAFPHRRYGLFDGTIDAVSETVHLPGESTPAPIQLSEPAYRITASIHKQHVTGPDSAIRLKPGMTFSADVRLGQHRLWKWLLEPVHRLRGSV